MSSIVQSRMQARAQSALSVPQSEELELALPSVSVISYSGPGGVGGVPASLAPMVKRLNTRVNWYALTEQPQADFTPPSDGNGRLSVKQQKAQSPTYFGFSFHKPTLPERLMDGHRRFCQSYLSPLLHGFPERAIFDQEDWKSFKQLNELMASHCLIANSDSYPSLFWLHDYQLSLASMLIGSQAGILLSQFWHVPFPSAKIITAYPCGKELVEALLQNRLVGFHTKDYAENFMDAAQFFYPELEVDRLAMTLISDRGKRTKLSVMPLGIDVPYWQNLARISKPYSEALAFKHDLAPQVILGVDRLESNKGILERLQGLKHLLSNKPEWHKRFHFVQIAQEVKEPSDELKEYTEAVERKIAIINNEFAKENWSPIIYIKGSLNHEELAAWYQKASVLSVNSTADGLNLVAKEFVAAREDEQGALVLSKNAGVSRELSHGAYLVDPNDAAGLSSQLFNALTADAEENHRRMLSLRHAIGWNQLHSWAQGFLRETLTTEENKF